MPCSS